MVATTEPKDIDSKLAKMLRFVKDFEDATIEDRKVSEQCRDYYDGYQWTKAEETKILERGQHPTVVNRIQPKVNFVLGSEMRTRVDPRGYPRSEIHNIDAEIAEDLIRYVTDSNKFQLIRSAVVGETAIEGYSGCLLDADPGKEGSGDIPKLTITHIPWDRLFYDPHSRKFDFSDAQYVGLILWMDIEAALELYPGHEDTFGTCRSSSTQSETTDDKPLRFFDSKRNRVQIFECYYKEGGVWYVTHYCYGGFLIEPEEVPFLDEKGKTWCPLRMTSGYIDRELGRYGIVKTMLSLQDEINKRHSKALYILSTRQLLVEDGAIDDIDTARNELAKPNGVLRVNKGAAVEKRVQILETQDLAQGQFQLLQEAKAGIDAVGPQGSLQPQNPSQDVSGRLFLAKQEAGSMELEPFFDHIRAWTQDVFEKIWLLLRQFCTEEMELRVRDDSTHAGYRFVKLNRKLTKAERIQEHFVRGLPIEECIETVMGPDGVELFKLLQQQAQQQAQIQAQQGQLLAQQTGQPPPPPPDPAAIQQQATQALMTSPTGQEEFTENDVAQLDLDILIEATPDNKLIEHEQYESLIELIRQGLIQVSPEILEMVLQASALRDKKKLIGIIKKPPDPQQVQQQQMQIKLQMETMQAQIAKLSADAAAQQAKAQLTAAQTAAEGANLQVGLPVTEADLNKAQAELARAKAQAEPEKVKAQAEAQRAGAFKSNMDALRPDPKPKEGGSK